MEFGAMSWWFWFGMQIFGVSSIVLTWWLFLDAFKRKGSPLRFAWPFVASAGLMMQIPAFLVVRSAQSTQIGTFTAGVGVVGLIVVTLATITHFYRSPGSGTGWSMRTRDEGSASLAPADRRKFRSPQASIPVSSTESRRPASISHGSKTTDVPASPVMQPAAAPSAPFADPQPPSPKKDRGPDSDYDATVVADDAGTIPAHDAEPQATIVAEPAPTLMEESPAGLPAETICDEPSATIVDEPGTILEDAASAEEPRVPSLVITDGRSSRIIITDRAGEFIVGRDPSKCTLAVEDSRASRAHFAITEAEGAYFIRDLGSSNGTFVNGALVKEAAELSDGDTVEFGRTIATFEAAKS